MNILVINGSPKGSSSITLQTVRYLALRFPQDSFDILNAAPLVTRGEKLTASLPLLQARIAAADLVLFSYPVYTFMAPSQLHALLHGLKAAGLRFPGKYATQLTTSKHFYDVTAHRFVEENCADLGFTVLPGLSADMEDLPTAAGQKQAEDFWRHIHFLCAGSTTPAVPKAKYTVTIVTDAAPGSPLAAGIARFQSLFPCQSECVNLRDFRFQGGCLGCLRCAATGQCIYKDGFDVFLRERIQSTDAIIYAFTVTDHSMGPLFKTYDDRQFCNGHRTVLMGHPVAYIVEGDLSAEQNLRTVLEARAQVGGTPLAAIAALDGGDAALQNLSAELLFALENAWQPPKNFYGVGGMRIFRDLIYQMQGIMKQDHRFFKAHGQYDFPQRSRGKIAAMYLVGLLFSNPKLMQKMGGKINEGMLAPYTKVLAQAEQTSSKAE